MSRRGFRYQAISSGLFYDLHQLTGSTAFVEYCEDVEQFGVWLEGADDLELVGTGDTETDALEDAICTARVWKQNEGRPAGRSYE